MKDERFDRLEWDLKGELRMALQHSGNNDPAVALQRVDEVHVLFGQLEVQDVIILLDSLWCDGFWNDHHPSLNLKPQEDLGGCFSMFGSNLLDLGVAQKIGPGPIHWDCACPFVHCSDQSWRSQGAVGGQNNAPLLTECSQFLLVQTWVALHLVGSWQYLKRNSFS